LRTDRTQALRKPVAASKSNSKSNQQTDYWEPVRYAGASRAVLRSHGRIGRPSSIRETRWLRLSRAATWDRTPTLYRNARPRLPFGRSRTPSVPIVVSCRHYAPDIEGMTNQCTCWEGASPDGLARNDETPPLQCLANQDWIVANEFTDFEIRYQSPWALIPEPPQTRTVFAVKQDLQELASIDQALGL